MLEIFQIWNWQEWISRCVALACVGLSFSILSRSGFFNLAITAQMIAAASFCGYVAYWCESQPVLAVVFGFIAAVVGAAIPVFGILYLRCRLSISEILLSLSVVYLSIPLSQCFLSRPGEMVAGTPQVSLDIQAHMTGGRVVFLACVVIVLVLLARLLFKRTVIGHKLAVMGDSEEALPLHARIKAAMWAAFFSVIPLALLATGDQFVFQGRYIQGRYDDIGFLAIPVAIISIGHFRHLVLVGALLVGTTDYLFTLLKAQNGIPKAWSMLIYALVLLFAAFAGSKDSQNYSKRLKHFFSKKGHLK